MNKVIGTMRCRHCGADYFGGRCIHCGSDEFVDVEEHYNPENVVAYRSVHMGSGSRDRMARVRGN